MDSIPKEACSNPNKLPATHYFSVVTRRAWLRIPTVHGFHTLPPLPLTHLSVSKWKSARSQKLGTIIHIYLWKMDPKNEHLMACKMILQLYSSPEVLKVWSGDLWVSENLSADLQDQNYFTIMLTYYLSLHSCSLTSIVKFSRGCMTCDIVTY